MTYQATVQDKLVEEVGDWIDQYNIARLIVEAIQDEWGAVDYDRCVELWYRACYELPSLLNNCARHLPDPVAD